VPELLYGDIEQIVVSWLASRFTDTRTCTELPATLPARTVQVVRYGGGRPELPVDLADVDVDCYAADRAAARLLAERVAHALIFDLPGHRFGTTTVTAAECLTAPSWAPYDNTTVRRMTAAFQFRTYNSI
jgi:hypothetical protein